MISDKSKLKSIYHIEEIIETLLAVKDVDALQDVEKTVKSSLALIAELTDGAKKAAKSLTSHFVNMQKLRNKEIKDKVAAQEKQEISAARARAATITSRLQAQAASLAPLFAADPSDDKLFTKMETL